jgi:hypothetical protein
MTAAGTVTDLDGSTQLVGIGSFEWIRLVRRVEFPQPGKYDPPSLVTKCLALLLASYADTKTGENVRPSRELLARVSGSNVRTVSRATKILTDAGLLECVERASSGGRGGSPRAAVYRLTMPADLLERVRVLDAKEKDWMSTGNEGSPLTGDSNEGSRVTGDSAPTDQGSAWNDLPIEKNELPILPNELPILPESSVSIGNPPLHSHLSTNTSLQGASVSSVTNAREGAATNANKTPPSDSEVDAEAEYLQAQAMLQVLPDLGQQAIAEARRKNPNLVLRQAVVFAARKLQESKGKAA